jgi:hypothetical protein
MWNQVSGFWSSHISKGHITMVASHHFLHHHFGSYSLGGVLPFSINPIPLRLNTYGTPVHESMQS